MTTTAQKLAAGKAQAAKEAAASKAKAVKADAAAKARKLAQQKKELSDLQKKLNEASGYYAKAPNSKLNYGDKTNAQRVAELQKQIAAKQKEIAGPVKTAPKAPTVTPGKTSSQAAPKAGKTVQDLQKLLNSKGAKLAVDGKLGPLTAAAAKKYGISTASYTGSTTTSSSGGGGGVGGTNASGGGGSLTTTGTPAAGSNDDVRSKYGYLAWALDLPEVGDLLRTAAKEGWDPSRTQAAIENTTWWRTTSATARQFFQKQKEDPQSAQQELDAQVEHVKSRAAELGVNITDPGRLRQLATTAITGAWDQTQLDNALAAEYHYTPGASTGFAGVTEQNIKKLAADYLIPLADSTTGDWITQSIRNGDTSGEGFRNYLITQAKSLFPTLGDVLDKGVTVNQYIDPYRQIAAKNLELSPDGINFSDPRWNKALNVIDPTTNQRRPMSLSEFDTMTKSDPSYGYDHTQGGRQQAADLTSQLGQLMGAL